MAGPFGEASRGADDPRSPHEFRPIEDFGIAAAAASGSSTVGRGQIGGIVMTDNFIRKSGCGMPGCGKPRHDPIHQPAA